MKAALLHALARLGLLGSAFRAYEAVRALGAAGATRSSDGLLLPPASLRIQVAGTPDAAWFVESGRAAAETLAGALERRARALDDVRSILDFGCGCGRVIRHLGRVPADLHGSDANATLAAWCSENLPFGRYAVNGLAPPLPYEDGAFELVYTMSVFTHLPADLQRPWLDELRRVVEPGGRLLLTTHGERYVERLTAAERRRFAAGELVVRWGEVAGTNLCTAFHPPEYVRALVRPCWELEELVAEGARGNPHQDLVVLRRT